MADYKLSSALGCSNHNLNTKQIGYTHFWKGQTTTSFQNAIKFCEDRGGTLAEVQTAEDFEVTRIAAGK